MRHLDILLITNNWEIFNSLDCDWSFKEHFVVVENRLLKENIYFPYTNILKIEEDWHEL